MPNLKFNSKQYHISDENFEAVPECEFGNFALGYVNDKYRFVPAYVGRSKTNLRDEIKSLSNQKLEEGKTYTHFKYKAALSELDAYERECKNYHDYVYRKDGSTKQLENEIHPVKPSGIASCPVEGCNQ